MAFTIAVDNSTDKVSFSSNVALEHNNTQGDGEDNTLDLGSISCRITSPEARQISRHIVDIFTPKK